MQASISHNWLATPIGNALIEHEQHIVEDVLDGVFGEQLLQLGVWGDAGAFIRYSRTQRACCLAEQKDASVGVIGSLHRLPVASESVDAVILPHTLEFSSRPQAILREVDRVLRSDGHLVVMGFRPGGLWGVRRIVPGAGLPPDTRQLIPERQLKDWLSLLDLKLLGAKSYVFRWPLPGNGGAVSMTWEARGQRWWPELGACYMLTAQKRMLTLTSVKKAAWRSRPKVVGGLVKPTTRISRIHVDENS